jgi:hypothetical protein
MARHDMPAPPAVTIGHFSRDRYFVDPQKSSYLKPLVSGEPAASLPADLDGMFIVGSPETLSALKPLCDQAGFQVASDKLTYKGTTIDLNHGGALAVVNLADGKHCLIGLGTFTKRPDFGKSRLAVFDEQGRLLRADTDPVETGSLALKLP